MSEDHRPPPASRYSRFSRVESAPAPQATAEPTLEEIAARALTRPRSTSARSQRGEISASFGSPEAIAAQPAPVEHTSRRHQPQQHIPAMAPVEHAYASTRGEAPFAVDMGFVPPAPPSVEHVEVEIVPEPPSRFAKTADEVPWLPPGRPIIAEFEVVPPEPGVAPSTRKKQRRAMPPLASLKLPSLNFPSLQGGGAKAGGKDTGGDESAKKGPSLSQRVIAAARSRAVPALQNGALWLAHNLQRKQLRKRYSEAVVFAHNRVLDRKLEKLFFVSTLQGVVKTPDPEQGILYDGPIPATVFDWAFTAIPDDLREFAFIDLRAGRGRTALLASKYPFDRIIGFEFDAQLFDDLQMNVAQFPRSLMKCRNIDCYRGDLNGISIPDQPSVLWFSSAWSDDMIPGVLEYVRETYRQSPRRLYAVFANTTNRPMLENDDVFQPVDPGINQRLKLKLLSPMEFQIYRTMT